MGKMSVQRFLGSKPSQVLLSVTRNQVSSQWGECGGGATALRTARERSKASRALWDMKMNQTHRLQEMWNDACESPRRFSSGRRGSRLKEA